MRSHAKREKNSPSGLCFNCLHTPDCVNGKGGDVLECELHETVIEVSARNNFLTERENIPEQILPINLCVTCGHEDDCSLSSRKESVLRCEEFV